MKKSEWHDPMSTEGTTEEIEDHNNTISNVSVSVLSTRYRILMLGCRS